MLHTKFALALAGLLSCLVLAELVSAQNPQPVGDGPPPPGPMQLTDANFPQLLKELGYKVETKESSQKEAYWIVRTEKDGWGYAVEVQPQRSKAAKQIVGFWLISDLTGTLNNPNALSAPALLKLLEKNHEMAPYFFSFNPATKQLAMNYEYPFGSIDKGGLERQFSALFGKIRDTHGLWKTDVLMAGGNPIPNPNPNPPPKPGVGLAETQWTGTETLPGYGPLTFKLSKGGEATMIDKDGASPGTWNHQGDQITLKFGDGSVIYKGTVNGPTMSGTAANGKDDWTFTLKQK